jgi:hypothetical protein
MPFAAVHDWPALKAGLLEALQAGRTAQAFAKEKGVPLDTFNKKARRWRAEWKAQAAKAHARPQAPRRTANIGQQREGGLPSVSSLLAVLPPGESVAQQGQGEGAADEAARVLREALPVAARALVAQLTTPDGAPSRDASATRAALQMLKDLQHTGQEKASPYAAMADAEIEARAVALWPSVMEARRVLAGGA